MVSFEIQFSLTSGRYPCHGYGPDIYLHGDLCFTHSQDWV